MTDPTAAERARRYRARHKAQRDAPVTVSVLNRDDAVTRLERIETLLEELVAALIHNVDKRDANGRHALERDVTERHGTEGAPAPARVRTRVSSPTGSRDPYVKDRDGVTPLVTEWIVDPSTGLTIDCADYRAHRFDHRRDPVTQRFRCYVCEPDPPADQPMYAGGSEDVVTR